MEKVAGTKQSIHGRRPLSRSKAAPPSLLTLVLTAAGFEVRAYRGGAMYASASFSGGSGTVPGHDDAERAVASPRLALPLSRDRDLKPQRRQANIKK